MEDEAELWQNVQVSYSGEFKLLETAAEEEEERKRWAKELREID